MYLKIICQTPMRIKCFNYKQFFLQIQIEKSHSILKKTKVPYQGSWREVFEQTYSQQTDNKEQTGALENLFSIKNLKISLIWFVIVPVMCIISY